MIYYTLAGHIFTKLIFFANLISLDKLDKLGLKNMYFLDIYDTIIFHN